MSNTTWLTNTSLKDLRTIKASILEALEMTEQENGFLIRINREIEEREGACQKALGKYNQALAGEAGIEPATIPLTAGGSTN